MIQNPKGGEKKLLYELAALAGVSTEYRDISGEICRPSIRALRHILSAMGHEDIKASLRDLRMRPFNRLIEPALAVYEDDQPLDIPLYIPCMEGEEEKVSIFFSLMDEEGVELETRTINGALPSDAMDHNGGRYIQVDIPLDFPRPMGYYDINAHASTPTCELSGRMRLIIAPRKCHMPEERTWGITLSLYGVRSHDNWGVGDFDDLCAIMKSARDLGAGFVGINPLHETPGTMELGISPYQPISRLYNNFIYAAPSGFSSKSRASASAMAQALRESDLVDYDAASALKLQALKETFEDFYENTYTRHQAHDEDSETGQFIAYCQQEGRTLETFATYMALRAHLLMTDVTADPARGWKAWPRQYQDPFSSDVAAFRDRHEKDVLFFKFIQWTLKRQIDDARQCGKDMAIGLYGDLAVGSASGGSDLWAFRDAFAEGMNMGAPPDDFSPFGQNWLFPPMLPGGLRKSGYELFIQTLRKNMIHCDALRIDHALGLFRAFWIPEGMGADEGTYVDYPHHDLLKIIALESVRSRTVIIAEDLGTVGENVHASLAEYGMLSYRLLYFERHWESGSFLPSDAYPRDALAAINTHDLPPMRGFWESSDIKQRQALRLYVDEAAYEAALLRRGNEKAALIDALSPCQPGPMGNGDAGETALIIAAHNLIAQTPSLLAAMSLDDALGLKVQQNLPGVVVGHPNWRRKYPVPITEIFGEGNPAALLKKLASVFKTARG